MKFPRARPTLRGMLAVAAAVALMLGLLAVIAKYTRLPTNATEALTYSTSSLSWPGSVLETYDAEARRLRPDDPTYWKTSGALFVVTYTKRDASGAEVDRAVVLIHQDGYCEHVATSQFGHELRLTSWGDGSAIPTSGKGLILLGADTNGLLHIRVFTEGGSLEADLDETMVPGTLAGAVAYLKGQLPSLLPPHVVTRTEKTQIIEKVILILGQAPLFPRVREEGR